MISVGCYPGCAVDHGCAAATATLGCGIQRLRRKERTRAVVPCKKLPDWNYTVVPTEDTKPGSYYSDAPKEILAILSFLSLELPVSPLSQEPAAVDINQGAVDKTASVTDEH